MEEPPAQGIPHQLAQLPQLPAPARGACPPGAVLSRVTSLSERISRPFSTLLKTDTQIHIALPHTSHVLFQVH